MKLEVKKLFFNYPKTKVLQDISFQGKAGDILCILGPNGSGKTTLFKCILGLLEQTSGDVLINEEETRKIPRGKIAKLLAYIPQAHTPTFNYKVLEVVLMGRTAHLSNFSSPSENDLKIALQALEQLNILYLKDKGYAEISGGERQLVLIARAIAQQSKILIMDEPTSNLDYGNQILVLNNVKKLAEQGYLIIMSSHNPEHAIFYAKQVLLMKAGKIIEFGKPREVISEEILEKIYGVKVKIFDVLNKKARVCIPLDVSI